MKAILSALLVCSAAAYNIHNSRNGTALLLQKHCDHSTDPTCPKKQCQPACTWHCTNPKCEEHCTPICAAPICKTYCKAIDLKTCSTNCEKPDCTVICPKSCAAGNCPKCKTVCGPPPCKTTCQQDCQSKCADPVCTYDCKRPTECPKPVCHLNCDNPCQNAFDGVNSAVPVVAGAVEVASGSAKTQMLGYGNNNATSSGDEIGPNEHVDVTDVTPAQD